MNNKYDGQYGLRQLALFNELEVDAGVSIDEVILWIESIPVLDPINPRAAWYYKWWSVADKIRAHKAAGTFMQAINCPQDEDLPQPRTQLTQEQKMRLIGALPASNYELEQHYRCILPTKLEKLF
jgi:hypothetical protein